MDTFEKSPQERIVDLGISPDAAKQPSGESVAAMMIAGRRAMAQELMLVLADSQALYMRTHGFHWNLEGPMFNTLHQMFEDQYSEQWAALDEIAERIRALGASVPGIYSGLADLSSVARDPSPDTTDWRGMIDQIATGNEAVCRSLRQAVGLAVRLDDAPTQDLLIQRLGIHEK